MKDQNKLRAEDLRKGNLVNYKFHIDSGGVKVVSITTKDLINIEGSKPLDSYKPIKITEEWLKRFGFISNPYIDAYELMKGDELIFLLDIDKTKGFLKIHWNHIEMKTVHQLQNLIFTLTGKELELKQD